MNVYDVVSRILQLETLDRAGLSEVLGGALEPVAHANRHYRFFEGPGFGSVDQVEYREPAEGAKGTRRFLTLTLHEDASLTQLDLEAAWGPGRPEEVMIHSRPEELVSVRFSVSEPYALHARIGMQSSIVKAISIVQHRS